MIMLIPEVLYIKHGIKIPNIIPIKYHPEVDCKMMTEIIPKINALK